MPWTKEQDTDLMKKVSLGDSDAINTLYDRFGRLVYKLAHQYTQTNHQTQDAVQEIFIRLWENSSRFDSRKAKLVTWVLLISRRYLIDQLRKKKIKTKTNEKNDLENIEATALKSRFSSERITLHQEIIKLPEPQKEILERVYIRGFTLKQISSQMNLPIGTIKSALSRGLQKIRTNLKH